MIRHPIVRYKALSLLVKRGKAKLKKLLKVIEEEQQKFYASLTTPRHFSVSTVSRFSIHILIFLSNSLLFFRQALSDDNSKICSMLTGTVDCSSSTSSDSEKYKLACSFMRTCHKNSYLIFSRSAHILYCQELLQYKLQQVCLNDQLWQQYK